MKGFSPLVHTGLGASCSCVHAPSCCTNSTELAVWVLVLCQIKRILPRLPCSSLCFGPLSFSHCWLSPGQGLQKSGGGAYWQGCRWPNPDWTPYGFTRPEKLTCRTVHILALPNLDLNKKEENSVGDTVQQWPSTLKGNFKKICRG